MPKGEEPESDFRLNEPAPEIPGGAHRKSTRVRRTSALGLVARREQLNELLRAHDPEDARRVLEQITLEDHALLRQMAREGAVTGVPPRLRQNAIAVLGRFASQENLNVLTELAQHGEDFYVRGHALMALGSSGVALAAPVLREALGAGEAFEVAAAERGLEALAAQCGPDVVRAVFADESRKAIADRGERLMSRLDGKPSTRRVARGQTTGEPPGST